jgi:hypothetical protein
LVADTPVGTSGTGELKEGGGGSDAGTWARSYSTRRR